jgi:tRNA dimethylallyltransferase
VPLLVFCIALDKVILIGGPTGSGKSAYASKLAQSHSGVILNADSLQVYRGLEILTAQPSLEDQRAIPHRLYGFLDPSESCSAGRWLSLVIPEIDAAHGNGQLPIVVGGTGLYLKTLLEGISAIPSIDLDIRKKLQKRENPYADLESVDPELASRLNPHDHQRIIRGLEVFYGTGKPLSFWQSQKPTPPPYAFEKILFMPSKE